MDKKWVYRRGDIYLANLEPNLGSEQSGIRPVIVVQNNLGNLHCPTLIVVPLTSKIRKKPILPVHCFLYRTGGLDMNTMVLAEQILTIDKQRIIKYVGRVNLQKMKRITDCLMVSLAIPDH